MNYHIISTSNVGHGAIFTNKNDAKAYQADHPGSVYQVADCLPDRIPPKSSIKHKSKVEPGEKPPVKSPEATTVPNIADLHGPLAVYTDGSCRGNPGPGGYGVVIVDAAGATQELSQGYGYTTNNRMELLAVIAALKIIPVSRAVTIHSDSQYVIGGITKGWARGWKAKGWKKGDGEPAVNPDLWGRLLDLLDGFDDITFKWVRGHAGNPLNEKADSLANGAARGENLIPDEGYKAPEYQGAGW